MEWFWWFRIAGTVIPAIWWQVIMLAAYAAAVVSIETFVPFLSQNFPSDLMNIIGLVIGLLLTFRTDTAYSRYWEGRELWSTLTQEIRKLTRAIWAGVKEREAKDVVEKMSALNLCIAFVVSLKHYVRDEYSYTYEDMQGLFEHLPKYYAPSSTLSLDDQKKLAKKYRTSKAYDKPTPTNIPIEVSYYLVSYAKYLEDSGSADGWALSTIHSSVEALVDTIAGFERIMRTPMPLAYSVHLHVSVWFYLMAIPFQIISDLGPWWTIPVTFFAGCCFLGILAVGFEIENPFGYDANDLPLEDFCEVIRCEIQAQIAGDVPKAKDWMYSPDNRPFGPMCTLSASQLSELSLQEVHEILNNCSRAQLMSSVQNMAEGRKLSTGGSGKKGSSSKGYQAL